MNESEIFKVVGADGFEKFVNLFYKKIKKDDLIGPMYPQDDWEGSEKRLLRFLLFRFGGDMTYIEERGHPRLRMRHFPFKISTPERDRWVKIMNEALDECRFPTLASSPLRAFFSDTASFLKNHPDEPSGCPVH